MIPYKNKVQMIEYNWNLKKCPCGAIPTALYLRDLDGQGMKWVRAECDVCGEWTIEFRSGESLSLVEAMEMAENIWNRKGSTTKQDGQGNAVV